MGINWNKLQYSLRRRQLPAALPSQVIKGCSAGRFDNGASFARFDCDFRDVCSRVDRLIVDGYVTRDDHNQQMLLYVPDPDKEEVSTCREAALVSN